MDKRKILQQIANTLYINVQQAKQSGLLQGKLGIAIFFYHYARYTGDESYNVFPNEYIEFLFNYLDKGKIEDFANGVSGIGWGFDYLTKNKFIETDDNILEDVDIAIEGLNPSDFEREFVLPIPLFSKGIYFLQRKNNDVLKETIPQIESFLQKNNPCQLPLMYVNSIFYVLTECVNCNIDADLCNYLLKKLQVESNYITKSETIDIEKIYINCLFDFIFSNSTYRLSDKAYLSYLSLNHVLIDLNYDNLSIYNGLAGIGLSIMLKDKCLDIQS